MSVLLYWPSDVQLRTSEISLRAFKQLSLGTSHQPGDLIPCLFKCNILFGTQQKDKYVDAIACPRNLKFLGKKQSNHQLTSVSSPQVVGAVSFSSFYSLELCMFFTSRFCCIQWNCSQVRAEF